MYLFTCLWVCGYKTLQSSYQNWTAINKSTINQCLGMLFWRPSNTIYTYFTRLFHRICFFWISFYDSTIIRWSYIFWESNINLFRYGVLPTCMYVDILDVFIAPFLSVKSFFRRQAASPGHHRGKLTWKQKKGSWKKMQKNTIQAINLWVSMFIFESVFQRFPCF